MRFATLLLGLVLAGLAGAGPAHAATVRLVDVCDRIGCYATEVIYEAAAGEANDVRLAGPRERQVITDPGAVIEASDGCTAQNPHTAVCSSERGSIRARVTLGGGDDRVTTETLELKADGGPGDDVLTGAGGADRLNGGGGRDTLASGDGDDRLTDGDARAGAVGADVLDGGAGTDRVSYAGRTRALEVRLGDRAPDGEAGEGDRVVGFEGVIGGRAGDLLVGEEGDGVFGGGPGRDRIYARGGDDFVFAYRGADLISGGAGRDQMAVSKAGARVRCGAGGEDDVYGAGPADVISGDCETIETTEMAQTTVKLTSRRGGVLVVKRTSCTEPCLLRTTLVSHTGGRRVVVARDRYRYGEPEGQRLHLTDAGRRLLRTRRRVSLTVRFRYRYRTGARPANGFLLRLG